MGGPRFHLRWRSGRIVDDPVDDVQEPVLEKQRYHRGNGTQWDRKV